VAAGASVLSGCGSGDTTVATTPANAFAGRSFTASHIDLGSLVYALSVTANSDETASGILVKEATSTSKASAAAKRTRADTALEFYPVSGTYDKRTGVFKLTGTGSPAGGETLTITGSLPTGSGTTGGSVQLSIAAQTGVSTSTSTFDGGTVPSPTPTPSPTPGAPTPTPTPISVMPSALGAHMVNYAPSDTLSYNSTTVSTFPVQASTTTTSNYTQIGGSPFSNARTGSVSQVPFTTPDGDTVTVSKQQQLDASGIVSGYSYFAQSSAGYMLYGSDAVNALGATTSTTRYSPAMKFDFTLQPGSSTSSTTTVAHVDLSSGTPVTTTFSESMSLNYLDTESITVPAGTFTNAAKVEIELNYTQPGVGETLSMNVRLVTDTWLASGLGQVESITYASSASSLLTSTTTNRLTAASVGGVNYPR